MVDEKFVALRRHPVCEGVEIEGIEALAAVAELRRVETDEYVVQGKQKMDSVYFVIQGRFFGSVHDMHDKPIMRRTLTRNTEFGLLQAAQLDAPTVNIYATEPSTILEIDHAELLKLAAKYQQLQYNLFRLAGNTVKASAYLDRRRFSPPMVAVIHHSDASRRLTREIVERLQKIEKTPCVASDDPNWQPIGNVAYRNLLDGGKLITREQGQQQLNEWAELGRVFVDIDLRHDFDQILRLIGNADQIFWCVRPQDAAEAIKLLSQAEAQVPGWKEKINLVWILEPNTTLAPLEPDLLKLVDFQFKVTFHDLGPHHGRMLRHGVDRIVQFLRGIRIGIALGGGAARGMAHLGALQVLEENGIYVNMVSGTSAGAMTGMVFAYGMDLDYAIECFKNDLRPGKLFNMFPHGGYWYLLHKYRWDKFDQMLRKYMGDARIEQLPLPMHSVTVDLVQGEAVIRETGDAVNAITESINLPGFSSPICREGRALVDGGLVNNIPADVLVEKGCNFVIASSVTAKLEPEFANIRPNRLDRIRRRPSTLQTIMRGFLVQSVNMNSIGVAPADVVIDIDATNFGLDEFTKTPELAELGRESARIEIDKMKRLLAEIDPQLYPKPSDAA